MRGWIVVVMLSRAPLVWGDGELEGPYPQELARRPILLPDGVFEGRFVFHAGRVPDEFSFGRSFLRLFATARAKLGVGKFELQAGATGFIADVPRQSRLATPADRIASGYVGAYYAVAPDAYVGGSVGVVNHEIVDSDDVLELSPRVAIGKRWRGAFNAAELHGFAGANFLYTADSEKNPVLGVSACFELGVSRQLAFDACGSVAGILDNTDSEVRGGVGGDVVFSPNNAIDLRAGVSYGGDIVIFSLGIAGRYFPRRR